MCTWFPERPHFRREIWNRGIITFSFRANQFYATSRGTTPSTNRRIRELRAPETKYIQNNSDLRTILRGIAGVSGTCGNSVEARMREVLHIVSKSSNTACTSGMPWARR
jgi:hypothetical protein